MKMQALIAQHAATTTATTTTAIIIVTAVVIGQKDPRLVKITVAG